MSQLEICMWGDLLEGKAKASSNLVCSPMRRAQTNLETLFPQDLLTTRWEFNYDCSLHSIKSYIASIRSCTQDFG